jgi:hypothetical protein
MTRKPQQPVPPEFYSIAAKRGENGKLNYSELATLLCSLALYPENSGLKGVLSSRIHTHEDADFMGQREIADLARVIFLSEAHKSTIALLSRDLCLGYTEDELSELRELLPVQVETNYERIMQLLGISPHRRK